MNDDRDSSSGSPEPGLGTPLATIAVWIAVPVACSIVATVLLNLYGDSAATGSVCLLVAVVVLSCRRRLTQLARHPLSWWMPRAVLPALMLAAVLLAIMVRTLPARGLRTQPDVDVEIADPVPDAHPRMQSGPSEIPDSQLASKSDDSDPDSPDSLVLKDEAEARDQWPLVDLFERQLAVTNPMLYNLLAEGVLP